MLTAEISRMRELICKTKPIVHCITNPISINLCANAILAAGGRPIMAEHPKEAAEITKSAAAVMLNIGNIADARMESMIISAKCCCENSIPFLLDIVGMACSEFRREFVKLLLDTAVPDIIKGNYSEVKALYGGYTASGIDSESIDISELDRISIALAKKHKTVILASGKTDIITDGARLFHIENGTERLCDVTGTGCMLGALCAAFMTVSQSINAAAASAVILGICGELAEKQKGNGSLMVSLMDNLSTVTDRDVEGKIRMEELNFEI